MKENEPNPLPAYFTGKQFTARLGETERAAARDFFDSILWAAKPPESAREFLNLLFNVVKRLNSNQSPANTEDVNALKSEIENLKSANERLQQLVNDKPAVQSEITNPKPEPDLLPAAKEAPLEDIRLFFLPEYRKTETDTLADLILNMKEAYDNTITGIIHNPLRLLEKDEYEALLKWDAEVFLPGISAMLTDEITEVQQLKAIYGDTFDIKKLLTSKHKFYLFWDFVQYDPAEKLEALIPNLTQEQKEALQEMRFPRFAAMVNVLRDLIQKANETDDDTTEHIQPGEENTAGGGGTEEGGRVIALNPERTAENPAGEVPAGGNGPDN